MNLPNRLRRREPVRGERAYVYAFKERAQRHHCLGYGTFSVDPAALEDLRRRYARSIAPITPVPIYVKATALALARNPEANAILFRRLLGLQIVHFEQVDVNLPITRKLDGRWITFIGTVRGAAGKSLAAIQQELTAYQRCPPEESPALRRFLRFSRMPLWLARVVHWRMTHSPEFYVRNVGTCGVTFLPGEDWYDHFLPIAPTSIVFGIGGVRREPVVRGDDIVVGRRLKCTLMADNYVIPGPLGMQVAADFQDLLETGAFIRDELPQSAEAADVP